MRWILGGAAVAALVSTTPALAGGGVVSETVDPSGLTSTGFGVTYSVEGYIPFVPEVLYPGDSLEEIVNFSPPITNGLTGVPKSWGENYECDCVVDAFNDGKDQVRIGGYVSGGGPDDDLQTFYFFLEYDGPSFPNDALIIPNTIYFNASIIPEPATWAMLLAGFGAVGSVLRGRSRRATG